MTIVKYLLLFSFTPFFLYSQAEEVLWIKQFETNEGCGVEKVLIKESRVYVALQFQGSLEIEDTILQSEGLFDLALVSYDIEGNLIWVLQAGSNNTDNTTALELTQDGRIIWTGLFWDELSLDEEKYLVTVRSRAIFVASVDAENGNVNWCNLIQGEGIKESHTIASDSSGNVLVGGFFNVSLFVDTIGIQSNSGSAGYFVVFNGEGRLVQHLVTEGTGFGEILAAQMSEDRIYISGTYTGNVVIGSETISGPLLDTDIFLAAFDKSGGLVWLSTATGILDDTVIELQLTVDERLVIAGNFSGRLLFGTGLELQSMGFASDIFAATYDLNGNAQSIFQISNPGNDVLMSFQKSSPGWIMSGTFDEEFLWDNELYETPEGSRSGFVLQLDEEFESTLSLNIALSEGFIGRSVADSEGVITAAGFSIPALTTFVGHEFIATSNYKGILVVYKSKPNSISEEGFHSAALRVYPNPAGKFIRVESTDLNQVILSTLTGNTIGSWRESEIQLPDLQNGLYILHIVMKNGIRQSVLIQIIN
jgi:hypothetical protein